MDKKLAIKVSITSIIANTVLSLFKLAAGIFAKSGAMISDAIHSASDVLSTFVVIAGINMASKKSDREHPYGHDRMECVAAIVLATLLCGTGLLIGYSGVKKIISASTETLVTPGALALVAAVFSIAVKEAMFWWTRAAAKKINSGALMADAWHHRSDALSSVGSFIGILGARLGLPILDPIASVVIAFFICKAAYDIFRDSVDKMVDKACPQDIVNQLREVIAATEGVNDIDVIHTRMFGSKIYVDVEISADGSKTLDESHMIAESVHDRLEAQFPAIKHCMVHVNPIDQPHDEPDRENAEINQ
ncbi:MAG TPA: cation diffusion facilitator family transporter [Oscillospiraceae bacterium]|mgnify:CR=1 FL=1|nr:cation diffusion facilitator family transporter [Oscillospiraceae bacterium]HPF55188.1 cation diffusion facilitator family transporter [Clostridiales bacterium]HPR75732.1 cation diffusion facilitator family transporter [Oscillospiraceae bacterium]